MNFLLYVTVFIFQLSMGLLSLAQDEQIKLFKTFDLNADLNTVDGTLQTTTDVNGRLITRSRFRSINGAGNNVLFPEFGKSFTEKIRVAPQEFPGKQMAGEDAATGLPSPREISNWLHSQPVNIAQNPFGLSSWAWAFGQFIDHDTAYEGEEENVTEYCLNPRCSVPIKVPANDPFFSKFGVTRLEFFRTPFTISPTNSFNSKRFLFKDRLKRDTPERRYLNVITSWVDASTVYGSTKKQSDNLRDLTPSGHGRLRTDSTGMFPPLVKDDSLTPPRLQFLVGDGRGNENLVLASIHTLFLREHNRLADLIWAARGLPKYCSGRCNDDIFEHARAYLIGLMQKITYDEWLPAFLGLENFKKFVGFRRGYNKSINPAMTMEFSVAAFRVGHSMVNDYLQRVNENFKEALKPLPLKDAFFREATSLVDTPEEVKFLLLGLGAQKSEAVDGFVVDALRNLLFGQGRDGMDLTSLNAQRNRDNGNNRFQTVRRFLCYYTLRITDPLQCPPFDSFDDFSGSLAVKKALKILYGRPEEVELFVAGLMEQTSAGKHIGPTFAALIGEQFKRIRDGDRFWYEDYLPPLLVKFIKKDNLAKVLARNLNVQLPTTYSNVFLVNH